MRRTYLDWAAAAPVSPRAARAYRKAARAFGNPASPHEEGRAAGAVLEDARTRIARLAMTKPDAVVFTAGATEANALAILGHIRALLAAGRDPSRTHVLYLPSAHASTRGSIEELASWGVVTEALPLAEGRIDLTALASLIRPDTVLVALEVVCGETGTRFDTRGVRQVLDAAREDGSARIQLHADASQLPLVESFELTRIASDTLALDSQKVGGVRGIGVLLAPRHVPLAPLMRGGGQERELRPGTPAPALASAFAAALEACTEERTAFAARAGAMRKRLLARIRADVERSVTNGGVVQVPHILNFSLPGRDTDYLATLLDEAGFAVSTRSACATDAEGSVAVRAMTGDAGRASSTLRVSWGPETRARDLDRFADALVRAVRFLDANVLY